jgi:hypothetical protein
MIEMLFMSTVMMRDALVMAILPTVCDITYALFENPLNKNSAGKSAHDFENRTGSLLNVHSIFGYTLSRERGVFQPVHSPGERELSYHTRGLKS